MPSPSIYWKEYDEPKKVWCPVRNEYYEVKGSYVCEDERVKGFAIIGGMGPKEDSPMYVMAVISFNDGGRWESEKLSDLSKFKIPEEPKDYLISQAEQYLNTLV